MRWLLERTPIIVIGAIALGALHLSDAIPYSTYGHMLTQWHTNLAIFTHRGVDAASSFEVMLPTVVTVLLGIFILFNRRSISRGLRSGIILYTFAVHSAYIVFRIGALNLRDPMSSTASVVLLAAELTHYVTMCCFYLQMIWPLRRSVETDEAERRVENNDFLPTVAILIPTYNEPESVLRRTVIGCQALRYPSSRFAVYLLDDTARSEIEELAIRLGCNYIAREHNTHAKAGNLNNAISLISEDLIAFFDCDNVPCSNFLSRLVGLFEDPRVALVISSLHYFNAENSGKNIGIEMLVASDHASVLSNSQSGRDTFNALLCFGTSYIARRHVLNEIGGIPTETLCEDWATSIRIQALGYKTLFVGEVLSTGLAAESLTEFVNQRLRWCQGTIQALYAATNPLTVPGLSMAQRVIHFFGVLYYIMYVVTFVSLVIPLLYFYFGVVPVEATLAQFVVFFLPSFLMQNFMYIACSGRVSSLISSQIADYLLCIPLTFVVLKTLVKPFGSRFRVTRKDRDVDAQYLRKAQRPHQTDEGPAFRVTLKGFTIDRFLPIPLFAYSMFAMFMLYAIGLGIGYQRADWYAAGAPFAAFALWGVYRITLLWMAFHASIDLPQARGATRFAEPAECLIYTEDGALVGAGDISNMSESGVEIINVKGDVPQLGLLSVPSALVDRINFREVRETQENTGHRLRFTNPTLKQHREIIEYLYCRPGRWENKYLAEAVAFKALWGFLLGIKP
jgi:cellulose synthase (UDP-forming)